MDALLNERRTAMLRTAFGLTITTALADPDVIEIMVNPDGRLWLDTLSVGRHATGTAIECAQVERIIRLVASHGRLEVHREAPIISAELEALGGGVKAARFEGLLPPVAAGPCFAIRKPALTLHRLDDYARAGMLSQGHAGLLCQTIRSRRNILIAGGTSSGKTTFANALLAEMADLDERLVVIEDTRELQCSAPDTVSLKTRPGVVTMADLVRSTLRLRPDRIIVGEVRGAEALDMLKAWNTGHPGGIATIHANSAIAALYRLEQLLQEAVTTVSRQLIIEAVDVIVFITGRGAGRRVESVCTVVGLDPDGRYRLCEKFGPNEENIDDLA
jgi:type IV secretion system protein TrbB